jgi:hypothetical protein
MKTACSPQPTAHRPGDEMHPRIQSWVDRHNRPLAERTTYLLGDLLIRARAIWTRGERGHLRRGRRDEASFPSPQPMSTACKAEIWPVWPSPWETFRLAGPGAVEHAGLRAAFSFAGLEVGGSIMSVV